MDLLRYTIQYIYIQYIYISYCHIQLWISSSDLRRLTNHDRNQLVRKKYRWNSSLVKVAGKSWSWFKRKTMVIYPWNSVQHLTSWVMTSWSPFITFIAHDGSMVLPYMVLHGSHQYTPVMLACQHHGSGVGHLAMILAGVRRSMGDLQDLNQWRYVNVPYFRYHMNWGYIPWN